MTSHVQRLAAVAATALRTFEFQVRRTGRTEDLVRLVEPGDQVVVSSAEERRHLMSELRRVGKTGVHVLVHDPRSGRLDNIRPSTDGRTYFESTWSYQFVLQQIEEVSSSFYQFEQHLNRGVEGPAEEPTRGSPMDRAQADRERQALLQRRSRGIFRRD